MSVKRMIKVRKVHKPRKTRTAVKSIDDKYYGAEPIDVSIRGYGEALNWYNYMFEQDQARDWLLEYMKKSDFQRDQIAAVRRCPKYRVMSTIGWQARIMMNGNELSDKSKAFFNERVEELLAFGAAIKEVPPKSDKPTITIRERTQAKARLLVTDCEEAIDLDPWLNIYDWLTGKEATPQAAATIREWYAGWELDFQFEDEFESRQEKKQRVDLLTYWTQFIQDCDRYIGNKKVSKVRKPREKKTKSAVDLVKKLKFMKEFPPLKIVSVNPGEIIGCAQLWAYNTKTKKLTRFDASGPGGIQVKGASLVGYDIESSITKNLRKPDVSIQQLLGAGKINLRKFMDELKSVSSQARGRINNDTILLRVIR